MLGCEREEIEEKKTHRSSSLSPLPIFSSLFAALLCLFFFLQSQRRKPKTHHGFRSGKAVYRRDFMGDNIGEAHGAFQQLQFAIQDSDLVDQTHTNGTLTKVNSLSATHSADVGDLLAIEGPPSAEQNMVPGLEGVTNAVDALALAPFDELSNTTVQVRVETDPSDRTQLRMTVASGDPALTFELKEFIKDQLVSIPAASVPAPGPPPPQPQPASQAAALSDPGAMIAGLL